MLDAHHHGHGWQYLVHWQGYSQEHDKWLPGAELQECQALDNWLASQGGSA